MSTTLLAAAAQAPSGTGSGVDCTALAVLRIDIDPRGSVLPGGGELDVSFDGGPTSSGPWTEMQTVRMQTGAQHGSTYEFPSTTRRVVLSGFDAFVRCRWVATSMWPGLALSLGVSG